jgi:hypothetical protein
MIILSTSHIAVKTHHMMPIPSRALGKRLRKAEFYKKNRVLSSIRARSILFAGYQRMTKLLMTDYKGGK